MSSNFSKIESYIAESIIELSKAGVDPTTSFPLPKTLLTKIINENKSGIFLDFTNKNDKDKLRSLWSSMIKRCHDEKSDGWKTHGQNGTTVCNQWRTNFDSFYDWSISNGYIFGLSLDRKDNKLGYSPDNCRWASHKIQARNRDNLKRYEAFGQSKLLIEWAESEKCLVGYECLKSRIKSKWDIVKALTTPTKEKRNGTKDS